MKRYPPQLQAAIDRALAEEESPRPSILAPSPAPEPPAKPTKYRNVPTERGGQRFDSKLEADVYDRLVAYYGKLNVIRQVSFPIGRKRIRPDFFVILAGRRFVVADAKGIATDAWKSKANHLRDVHGIEIVLIHKAEEAISKIEERNG